MMIFLKPKNDSHWHTLFRYEPSTGSLVNRVGRRKARAGAVAGSAFALGYLYIGFRGKRYLAHRIIWEMVNGPIPDGMEIDHINGVRGDNRLPNLRLVSHRGNMRNRCQFKNNTSGLQGVSWHKSSGKYQSRIWRDDGCKYLGLFDTAEQAHQAYQAAARELGYHENHGRKPC